MPKRTKGNKSAIERYVTIIDNMLNENKKDLTKAFFINEIGCSEKTFEDDLHTLRNNFNLKIKVKKNIYILDKNDLPKNLLAKSDMTEIYSFILAQQISFLSNNGSLENKKNLINKVLGIDISELSDDIDYWILPEMPIKITGINHFEKILRNIHLESALKITFKHPYREDETLIILPLSLKQFQFRWYVIGIDINNMIIRVALNWITKIEQVEDLEMKPPIDGSFVKNYYKDVIGLIKEGVAEEVKLKFSKQQYKYVESIPIHESQEKIDEDNETITVKLNVVLNYELVMKILAWNVEVEVLQPDSLRRKIKETLQKTLKKYN